MSASTVAVLDGVQRAVATFELPAVESIDGPLVVGDDHARRSFRWAVAERLAGLWCAAANDGVLQMSPEVLEECRAAHVEVLRGALTCEATAVEVVSALAARGVQMWLHKGIPVAHLDHPDPARRSFVDVDLLVRRDELAVARGTLEQAGFSAVEPAGHPWWERRFARSVVFRSVEGVEVDVHATVAVGWFGEVLDHAALRGLEAEELVLGGVRCRALSAEGRFLASCYALELSRGPRVRYMRDLAQQLLVTECDWRAAVRIAGHERGDAVIARAVLRAASTLRLDPALPIVQWAFDVHPGSRARRALGYSEAAETHGWRADAHSIMLALGPLDRARFLAGVVFPPSEVRAARHWTARDQVRRAAAFRRAGR
jgi:hypothetical protein